MDVVHALLRRLRRRPVDPERALQLARAEARRRATREAVHRELSGGLGSGTGAP